MFYIVFGNESPKAKIEAPKNISCLALLRYFIVCLFFCANSTKMFSAVVCARAISIITILIIIIYDS